MKRFFKRRDHCDSNRLEKVFVNRISKIAFVSEKDFRHWTVGLYRRQIACVVGYFTTRQRKGD